jgi:hypothetical protein
MGRPKKSAPKPAEIEPEEISQEEPEEEPETEEDDEPAARGKPTISKAEAVREALAQGKDGPEEGTDYILSQYGIDMTRQMFSSYKAQEKARQAKKGDAPAAETEPRRRAPSAPVPAPAPQATGLIGDIHAVRQLIAKHGAEGLKALVDALA